jgi:Putative auto-transporter adhesin, head GIN domain
MSKLLLPLLLVGLMLTTGCHHGRHHEVAGSGTRVTQKRNVSSFTSIAIEGAFTLEVVCQKDLSLELEGDDNILPLVSTDVSSVGVLNLKSRQGYSTREPVVVRISVPNLEGLSVSGAGFINISGMKNEKFEMDINGAAIIKASGTTQVLDVETNGAAKIDTHNLRASRAVVDSKGVSIVDVAASEQLDVTISGPSRVTYHGDPVVTKTVHGPGRVEKKESEGA